MKRGKETAALVSLYSTQAAGRAEEADFLLLFLVGPAVQFTVLFLLFRDSGVFVQVEVRTLFLRPSHGLDIGGSLSFVLFSWVTSILVSSGGRRKLVMLFFFSFS